MKVFEYCIVYTPKENIDAYGKDRQDDKPRILVTPTVVLAADQAKAAMIAARAIPEDFIDKLDSIEVAVRPF